jgi:hypothetical protein
MDNDRNYTFPESYNGKNLLHLKALLGAGDDQSAIEKDQGVLTINCKNTNVFLQ